MRLPSHASKTLALLAFSLGACAHSGELDVYPPKSANFGTSLEVAKPIFDQVCDNYEVRTLDVVALPVAKESHIQVDCQGLHHAGGSRLGEFVFADDSLVFVWVLTSAEEEEVLLAALRQTYGDPTHDTPVLVAFADDRAALRRDKPELLYYSKAVAPLYEAFFDQAAGQ